MIYYLINLDKFSYNLKNESKKGVRLTGVTNDETNDFYPEEITVNETKSNHHNKYNRPTEVEYKEEEEEEEEEEDDASLQPTSIFEYEQPTYTRMSPTLESSSSSHSTALVAQSSSNCFSQNSQQSNIKSQFYFNENPMQTSSTSISLNNADANTNLVKKKRGRKPKSLLNENCTINNSNSQFQVNDNGNLKVIIITIVLKKEEDSIFGQGTVAYIKRTINFI